MKDEQNGCLNYNHPCVWRAQGAGTVGRPQQAGYRRVGLQSIKKLRIRKPRIADSTFLENSLWTWEFHASNQESA